MTNRSVDHYAVLQRFGTRCTELWNGLWKEGQMGRRLLSRGDFDVVRELCPSNVWNLFELMRICEDEIAKYIKNSPLLTKELNAVFGVACPTPGLRGKSEELYRHHVLELISRAYDGNQADMRPGTKAEVLAALSDGSLIAPPGQQWSALMEELCAEMGFAPPDGEPTKPPWPTASADLLFEARRKLAVPERILKL